MVNKTSASGHQEQEKKKDLQVSKICIWGMPHFSGKKPLSLHMGQRENTCKEAVWRYQKGTCMILDLEQQLKSHFRRTDFFSPNLLKHLPDYIDKNIFCNSLWLPCWGCKYNCKAPSAFHAKGAQGALQIAGRGSISSPLLNTIPAEDSNCTHELTSLLFPHSLKGTPLMKLSKRCKWRVLK